MHGYAVASGKVRIFICYLTAAGELSRSREGKKICTNNVHMFLNLIRYIVLKFPSQCLASVRIDRSRQERRWTNTVMWVWSRTDHLHLLHIEQFALIIYSKHINGRTHTNIKELSTQEKPKKCSYRYLFIQCIVTYPGRILMHSSTMSA